MILLATTGHPSNPQAAAAIAGVRKLCRQMRFHFAPKVDPDFRPVGPDELVPLTDKGVRQHDDFAGPYQVGRQAHTAWETEVSPPGVNQHATGMGETYP
jgi:hypothetical protein